MIRLITTQKSISLSLLYFICSFQFPIRFFCSIWIQTPNFVIHSGRIIMWWFDSSLPKVATKEGLFRSGFYSGSFQKHTNQLITKARQVDVVFRGRKWANASRRAARRSLSLHVHSVIFRGHPTQAKKISALQSLQRNLEALWSSLCIFSRFLNYQYTCQK